MKKATLLTVLVAMALIALPQVAAAFKPGPRILPRTSTIRVVKKIENRQSNQMSRIYNGIIDGRLTRSEAKRLLRDQRTIRRRVARDLRDGLMMPYESRRIRSMQRRASVKITRLLRNHKRRAMLRRPYNPGPRPYVVKPPHMKKYKKLKKVKKVKKVRKYKKMKTASATWL